MHIKIVQIINMQYNLSKDRKHWIEWQSQYVSLKIRLEKSISHCYIWVGNEVGMKVLLFARYFISVFAYSHSWCLSLVKVSLMRCYLSLYFWVFPWHLQGRAALNLIPKVVRKTIIFSLTFCSLWIFALTLMFGYIIWILKNIALNYSFY